MPKVREKRFQRKKKVVFQEVDGLIHILDEREDAIITLNETATSLWKFLSKPRTFKELTERLTSIYKVNFKEAQADVEKFISKIGKKGLLSKL